MAKPKMTVRKSSDDQYYFTVMGANGECQCVSEMYKTRFNAERGFYDAAASVLQILWDKGVLAEELTRAGLIDKIVKSV